MDATIRHVDTLSRPGQLLITLDLGGGQTADISVDVATGEALTPKLARLLAAEIAPLRSGRTAEQVAAALVGRRIPL